MYMKVIINTSIFLIIEKVMIVNILYYNYNKFYISYFLGVYQMKNHKNGFSESTASSVIPSVLCSVQFFNIMLNDFFGKNRKHERGAGIRYTNTGGIKETTPDSHQDDGSQQGRVY